jgi:hypothetical protein
MPSADHIPFYAYVRRPERGETMFVVISYMLAMRFFWFLFIGVEYSIGPNSISKHVADDLHLIVAIDTSVRYIGRCHDIQRNDTRSLIDAFFSSGSPDPLTFLHTVRGVVETVVKMVDLVLFSVFSVYGPFGCPFYAVPYITPECAVGYALFNSSIVCLS